MHSHPLYNNLSVFFMNLFSQFNINTIHLALKQDEPSQRRLSEPTGQQMFFYIEDFSLLIQIYILNKGIVLYHPVKLNDIELSP